MSTVYNIALLLQYSQLIWTYIHKLDRVLHFVKNLFDLLSKQLKIAFTLKTISYNITSTPIVGQFQYKVKTVSVIGVIFATNSLTHT